MKFFKIIVSLLPYLLVFIASLHTPSDPDLGWHLKYGEYFFKHGTILRDNTFSTLMPDFHWANFSWGTDIITYSAFAIAGFLGLSILGATIVTLTFFFYAKAAKLSIWDEALLFPFLLYLESPINNISFRGQQISLFFLGLLVYLLIKFEEKPKIIYLAIPLFLIWVNLHGQFILGLAFFGLWLGLTILQKYFFTYKRNFKQTLLQSKTIGIAFFLSFIATFINPFGIGVHVDAISHVGSPLLKYVAEYLPFPTLSQAWWNQVVVAILLGMGLIFLFFKEKLSSKIPIFGGIILLYILSFNVRRYAWPAYYLTLPILKSLSNTFKPDKKKMTYVASFVILIFVLVIVIVGKYPFNKFINYSWESFCNYSYNSCSVKSAEFLVEHNLTINLFSQYGWGGFLIWNYPEIKPTIDGRMHIWKDENGYSGFVDYYEYEQNFKDIDKSKYDVVYMSPNKPIYKHMIKLVNEKKWSLVYEDKFAGVFVRNK